MLGHRDGSGELGASRRRSDDLRQDSTQVPGKRLRNRTRRTRARQEVPAVDRCLHRGNDQHESAVQVDAFDRGGRTTPPARGSKEVPRSSVEPLLESGEIVRPTEPARRRWSDPEVQRRGHDPQRLEKVPRHLADIPPAAGRRKVRRPRWHDRGGACRVAQGRLEQALDQRVRAARSSHLAPRPEVLGRPPSLQTEGGHRRNREHAPGRRHDPHASLTRRTPYRIRTGATAVKGRGPGPLDEGGPLRPASRWQPGQHSRRRGSVPHR